jgi:serine protease AprX
MVDSWRVGASIALWRSGARRALAVVAVAAMVAVATPVPTHAADTPLHDVIVTVDAAADARAIVEGVGGEIASDLGIIDGVAARVPAGAVEALAANPAVVSVTPDGSVTLHGWAGNNDKRGRQHVSLIADKIVNADKFWADGYLGGGIGVALIDSGVSPVDGLLTPGKVVNGPDLSFESQDPSLTHLDGFGHGTHLAGIIAGRATSAPSRPKANDSKKHFLGIAPDATIVNVKVATRDGIADVSQVIAAIDWVVQHRNDNGMNIRVLNLSFGTDATQSYLLDPLAFAVEQAWKHGIVVVVAAGNDGNGAVLRNPALDPFVIAVGATDGKGTARVKDDVIAGFSNCGTADRHVDIVATGRSVTSLLAPRSEAAKSRESIVGDEIVGSGTSQAAAIVSGAAALVIDQRPAITPDQVKALLMDSAAPLRKTSDTCQGAGAVDLNKARNTATPQFHQTFAPATGTGTIDGARGSYRLIHDGVVLDGERDIFGNPWDGSGWANLAAAGMSWSGGSWNGASWSGASWSGMSWSGASWSGASWSGMSWSGASWSGASWSGMSWSGASWSSSAWLGLSWNGTAML